MSSTLQAKRQAVWDGKHKMTFSSFEETGVELGRLARLLYYIRQETKDPWVKKQINEFTIGFFRGVEEPIDSIIHHDIEEEINQHNLYVG